MTSLPLFLITVVWAFLMPALAGQEVKRIAIVRDGPSLYFDEVIAGFREELAGLAEGRYEFEILDQYDAKGDPDAIRAQLLRAVSDPAIDVVYAAGILTSAQAQDLPEAVRTTPVVAGAIEFSDVNNESTSESGTSAVPNFTFIKESRRIPADLAELARLSGETTLYSFIDQTVQAMMTGVAERVAIIEKNVGVRVKLIPTGATAASGLAGLPKSARVVYVPILPSLRKGEREKLFQELAVRRVVNLSMVGHADVELGALAGLSPDNSQALHRRTALNVHQLLSGIPTSLLPVVLRSNDQLRINMKTAQQIGWAPDYDTLLSAELLHAEDLQPTEGELSLERAMAIAGRNNADARLARERWVAAYWETNSTRTNLYPQVSVSGQWGHQGIADRINPLASANADSFSLGAELNQLLYSDRLTSAIRSQVEIEAATKLDVESIQLDSMESTGLAYLDCLLAEALYLIEKENLALVVQNKNLAQTRSDIGAAEPSEVFRWQASVAQGKAQLIQRDSNRKNARVQLNVLMGVPRTRNWAFTDIVLGDEDYYFMDGVLDPLLQDTEDFERYTRFVQAMAVWQAPELRAFEKNLSAQGILLAERNRRNFRPEVSLSAGAQRLLAETSQDYDSQTEWTVGVGFTIPLFEGGLRKTESERLRAIIRQLVAQRDKALYQIEQRALSSIYNASASHPGLRLSRQAREAAQKNYDSVQSKYSRGAATIVNLLDAQSQLITQKQAEVSSRYQYLKDIVSIQRSMAWFEYLKTPEEKAAWTRMLKSFLQTGSLHVSLKETSR